MVLRSGRLALMFIAAAAAGSGCKKKEKGMPPLVAEVHAGLEGYRERACKCPDFDCADKVIKEMGHWILDNRARFIDVDKHSTPAQIEAAKKISAEINTCARAVVPKR